MRLPGGYCGALKAVAHKMNHHDDLDTYLHFKIYIGRWFKEDA